MEKILIVDDQASGRESLRALLQAMGYQVAIAGDSQTAISQAKSFLPGVALIDWYLKEDHTGNYVGRRLLERLPRLQVIYMTGSQTEQIAACVPNARILEKPFQVSELMQALENGRPDRIASSAPQGDSEIMQHILEARTP